jgi:hypothetical protein
MSCALVDNIDYPPYIKNILDTLSVGNGNPEAKNCACLLKTPLNEDGCPILTSDNKFAVFPFCWTFIEGQPPTPFASQPLKLTADQAMELYWKSNSVSNINLTYQSKAFGGCPQDSYFYMRPDGNTKLEKRKFLDNQLLLDNRDIKKLLCSHYVAFSQDFELEDCDGNISYDRFEVMKFFGGQNYINKENNIYYFYPSTYINIAFYTTVLNSTLTPCIIPCSPEEGVVFTLNIKGISVEAAPTQWDYDEFTTQNLWTFNNTTINIS